MVDDSSAPATKQDIAMLMDSIGKLYVANEGWKDEILTAQEGWKREILTAQKEWKDELKRHFDVVAEQYFHELAGANKDEIISIKTRVERLEEHTGLLAA